MICDFAARSFEDETHCRCQVTRETFTWQVHCLSFAMASGWASALRVTTLPAICATQSFGNDTDSCTRCELFKQKEFTRRADAQPLAEVSTRDASFSRIRSIAPLAFCDSSVLIRVIRGSTLRFNHRRQHSNHEARSPQQDRMAKGAIHPTHWGPRTLKCER